MAFSDWASRGLAPVVFVVLWAGGFTAIRLGLDHTGPLMLQLIRYAIVVAGLLPLALLLRPALPGPAQLRQLAVTGVLMQFGYFAGCNLATANGLSPSGLALIVCLQPIAVALLAPALAGETIGLRRWAGLLLGLVGAALVILGGGTLPAGLGLGLVFAFAAMAVLTGSAFHERKHGRPCHPVIANLVQFSVGLALTLPLALLTEDLRVTDWRGLGWPIAYLVLCNSLLATSLFLWMLRRGEAARVSALFFLVPPVAALIAWIVLGQVMPPLAWLGTALAAAGVALVRLRGAAAQAALPPNPAQARPAGAAPASEPS
jgi:drug/metabolite transporter (DMT)-like permease